MKSLIKSGIGLALGLLATSAGAQDVSRWQASGPQEAAVRPVGLSQPVRLEPAADVGATSGSFRPITIRAQAADDKTVIIGPVLGAKEPPLKVDPKPLPKDSTVFPPQPQPLSVMPMPSTVWGSMGIMNEGDCGLGDCGLGDCCGPSRCGSPFSNPGCCGPRPQFWFGAEYLMWWQKGQSVPPLVTTSPNSITPAIAAGVLGQPNTSNLYDQIPNPMRSGGRFTFGTWLPNCCNLGIEASFFFLLRQDDTTLFGSNGDPQIALPFVNVAGVPRQASELVSINRPNDGVNSVVQFGTASVHSYSQIWGGDINLRKKWLCGPNYWVDFLAGYRHLNLSEGIDINETFATSQFGTAPSNFAFQGHNGFYTRNEFNGAQIGLDGECRFWNRMFFGMNTKLAMGSVYQIVNIQGSQTILTGPLAGTYPGDLYASPTNMGRYTASRFAVVPEVGLKLGYNISDHCRIYVGYNFLYLSNAVRPADQIDTRVNPNYNFPPVSNVGPRFPAVLFKTSDYFAQGVTFGFQYRW